jgi:hypothetical protein
MLIFGLIIKCFRPAVNLCLRQGVTEYEKELFN